MFAAIREFLVGSEEDRLWSAVLHDNRPFITKYLASGGDPNRTYLIARGSNTVGVRPRPLAVWAAIYNHYELVTLLIDGGARNDTFDPNDGRSLLDFSAEANQLKVLKKLLKLGATPSASALYLAVARGHLDAARILIDHGADVQAANAGGRSLLEAVGVMQSGRYSCGTSKLKKTRSGE